MGFRWWNLAPYGDPLAFRFVFHPGCVQFCVVPLEFEQHLVWRNGRTGFEINCVDLTWDSIGPAQRLLDLHSRSPPAPPYRIVL